MWWLQPGWTDAICPQCGKKIWPEGDPDWGLCYECLTMKNENDERNKGSREMRYLCDICKKGEAVTGINKYAVCSEECADIALERILMEQK